MDNIRKFCKIEIQRNWYRRMLLTMVDIVNLSLKMLSVVLVLPTFFYLEIHDRIPHIFPKVINKVYYTFTRNCCLDFVPLKCTWYNYKIHIFVHATIESHQLNITLNNIHLYMHSNYSQLITMYSSELKIKLNS